MGARCVLELYLLGILLGVLVALETFLEVRRSYACRCFLLLIVEEFRRVDEVPPFFCLQHLRMGRQGKDFGGHVSIRVRRLLRFLWMICMDFFRSVGKTPQCQRPVCVRCGLHTRRGCDNDLVLVLCTNPHVPVFSNYLKWQLYCG